MADVNGPETPADGPALYPAPEFTALFADNVSSCAIGSEMVKFYLNRIYPPFFGNGPNRGHVVAQLTMPTTGFVSAVLFLETQLKRLVAANIVSAEYVEDMRRRLSEPSPAADDAP